MVVRYASLLALAAGLAVVGTTDQTLGFVGDTPETRGGGSGGPLGPAIAQAMPSLSQPSMSRSRPPSQSLSSGSSAPTTSAPPVSAIGTPAPQVPTISPLSPSVTTSTSNLTAGGSA